MDSPAPDFSHLTPLERIELAQQLWDSLPVSAHQPTEPGIAASWDEETARRRAELDAGRLQTIPVADVFAALDQRLER